MAPFLDFDGDGSYNPAAGDYPWFDFLQEIDCGNRRREDLVPLYGDQNFYWILNDKGNVHSESQGEPIGMEIRAQAFAFSTNDEVNNMSFYNYVLINQGTQTLTNTYMAQWVDVDLGGHTDDYVGVDVRRGLGYGYNGDQFDEPTSYSIGYGENPPAMGVDFFEGPYQDADGLDNPLTEVFSDAVDSLGIPYEGIGIGYGDGVVDNERYGMRKFLYYNWNFGINGQPTLASHYYNYMRGFWKNGQRMAYGGDGLSAGSGANLDIAADYMFPGDTDPYQWGTVGVEVEDWTEISANNPAGDRLFLQSAGPFTLEPGDYNNITVGMVWARATGGDPFESVQLLRIADDKAQALFDNCFEIVSGPDAPDVTIQELENELILYLTNNNPISNNFQETYTAIDPGISKELPDGTLLTEEDRSYEFEGYQIYQLADETVSPSDLQNIEKARLIFQCDLANDVSQVVNYNFDEVMQVPVPSLMANGANEGIRHSFQVTTDAFAQGDNALVNHKTYYFMALAYGYNNFADYTPSDEGAVGQDTQYLASRKAAVGSIRVYSGTPHKPTVESGGVVVAADYGDGLSLTRLEGRGNALNDLALTPESEAALVASPNGKLSEVTYQAGKSPVEVRVIDPLAVPAGEFELRVLGEHLLYPPGEHWRGLRWPGAGGQWRSHRGGQRLSWRRIGGLRALPLRRGTASRHAPYRGNGRGRGRRRSPASPGDSSGAALSPGRGRGRRRAGGDGLHHDRHPGLHARYGRARSRHHGGGDPGPRASHVHTVPGIGTFDCPLWGIGSAPAIQVSATAAKVHRDAAVSSCGQVSLQGQYVG